MKGGRLIVDISPPSTVSMGCNKAISQRYYQSLLEYFLKLNDVMIMLLTALKAKQYKNVKYIHYNDAGENEALDRLCKEGEIVINASNTIHPNS